MMQATQISEVFMARKRNLIPALITAKGWTITEFQLNARLPWGTAHKIATDVYLGDRTALKTLQSAANALGVNVDDLYIDEGE